MKCSAFIATSVDGYIAKPDDSVDWLHSAGDPKADMSAFGDAGFSDYLSTVDCMIMGRKCMEVISGFDLTPDQWPYGDLKIYALSNTLREAPPNLSDKVEMYAGDLNQLIAKLEKQGYKHAYIDGGRTIQAFLNLKLMNEMTISLAPVLLGGGKPLFGETSEEIKLSHVGTVSYPNGFVQLKYAVHYAGSNDE